MSVSARDPDARDGAFPADRWRAEVDRSWTGRWAIPPLLHEPPPDDGRARLASLSMSGVGPAKLASALSQASCWDEVYGASADAGEVAARLATLGMRTLLPPDAGYPSCLAAIDSPPLLLYVRGADPAWLPPMVGLVGARVCTSGGARFARRLAETIAAAGFTVVSGLARGIDAAAHAGALAAGVTAGVVGSGLDVVYPSEHAGIAERIARSGCLLSEFPPGAEPRPWHFPARNRIIAGLCFALVIVEAGSRSGALITADFALEYGRELMACTVAPESPSGAGVRALLRDGARLVVDPDQAVEDLVALAAAQGLGPPREAQFGRTGRAADGRSAGRRGPPPMPDGDGGVVVRAVLEATTIDEVVERTGLPVGRAAGLLARLTLDGHLIESAPGRWTRPQEVTS